MTAMQQLINEIVEHLTYDDDLTEDSRIALETIRLRCLGKLEMEKQQIERDFINGYKNADVPLNHKLLDEYYTSTYGSKGSDENFKQFSLYEHKETITSSDTKVSETFLDHVPDVRNMVSSQTEISDEEIEKGAKEWYNKEGAYSASAIALKTWVYAIKWYREQLKQRQ